MTDYLDATRWRWVLSDNRGTFLADHVVHLDSTTRECGGFRDVSTYLDYYQPIHTPEKQLADLGTWIGEKVFGGLRTALWQRRVLPAIAVQVIVPRAAQDLLSRPFELARFADGTSFRAAGIRFVYGLEGTTDGPVTKEPVEKSLRILAVFSLPVRVNPLNLRREHHGLQRLVRELNQTQNLAVELRVLQYGATQDTLREALEDADSWDIIHLSGHGQEGELLLEDDRGGSDIVNAKTLGELLDLARSRLKLLILDACYSGVGSQSAARRQLGLEGTTVRRRVPRGRPWPRPPVRRCRAWPRSCRSAGLRRAGHALPCGRRFRHGADAGALRKAAGEATAAAGGTEPGPDRGPGCRHPQAAPVADHAHTGGRTRSRAATGTAPAKGGDVYHAHGGPRHRLSARAGAVRRPSATDAAVEPSTGQGERESAACCFMACPGRARRRGAGTGLPARAWPLPGLRLAPRPEADSDIADALFNVMQDIQTQLNAPNLGLTTALDQPDRFRQYTLPRLRTLLQQNSLLLVLDNLETLLTPSDGWRVPLWGEVVAALLAHDGPSRIVFTSRRVPADLARHPKVQVEAIHALSFAESVLLARELPNLKRLFDDQAGRTLLQQTLRVVQGHPKMLELADGLAADRSALAARVAASANELADRADVLNAFFAVGGPHEGETRQGDADFMQALQRWTSGVAGTLTPTARLLFAFLSRLEPVDRQQSILEANWKDFLTRLGEGHIVAAAALAEPEQGLPAALAALEAAGLVGVERSHLGPEQVKELKTLLASHPELAGLDLAALQGLLDAAAVQATTYTIHPGVAEAVRATAEPAALNAADVELGNYHIAMYQHELKSEMKGGGGTVVDSARRAAPYLLRQGRWKEASTLLELMLQRDLSPDSLAFALPLLRRIVEVTAGTESELIDAGILARTLSQARRTAEAESILRDVIAQGAAQDNYRVASAFVGDLCNLLRNSGRLEEALKVAEEKAAYTRQAGLGPWTQLVDEGHRLQVLAAMGRYDEVLAEVESLRPKMDALPLESEVKQTVNPWNVRETLLDTGHTAALYSERWETALALNAEVVKVTQAHGADALEVARTRFNDYFPLLRLGRYHDARTLLMNCRAVFEAERHIEMLGKVYSALADLELKTGGRAAATRFEEVALGYSYQAGDPEPCAISHHNLAIYLERQGADLGTVLAHRLAAAAIRLQMQSGLLPTTLRNLVRSALPPNPPAFAEVVRRVEAIEGVRFQALFERLPRTAPDGDAAIAAVWQRVADAKRQMLSKFEPLLQLISAAAKDESQRAEIEPLLAEWEEKGWRLTDPVHRIWAGERNSKALTTGLDEEDSAGAPRSGTTGPLRTETGHGQRYLHDPACYRH